MKALRIASLALADTRHEWRMSLCMMLAVAAIAAPLLLFFGLKSGTVETMRKRLLDNPATLEILPATERLLDSAWFEKLRQNPGVAFVVPRTRKLSAQGDIALAGGKAAPKRVDLQPTMSGDILLERFHTPVPGPDQCVLTARAAELAGLKSGDTVSLTVSRMMRGTMEKARHEFSVVGVLPPRAGSLPAAYIPLAQLEYIEDYKDGRAVPVFGWPGGNPTVSPAFPSLLLFLSQPLSPSQEALLLQGTGFGSLTMLEGDAARDMGFAGLVYRLKAVGSMAEERNIQAAQESLRGLGAVIVPEAAPLGVTLVQGNRQVVLTPRPAASLTGPPPARELPDAPARWQSLDIDDPPFTLLVSPALAEAFGNVRHEADIAALAGEKNSLRLPVRLVPDPSVPAGQAALPLALLGSLNVLQIRPVILGDNSKGEKILLLGRRGYSGFRMYAKGLDDVAPLAAELEADGIRADTHADRIDEVRQLDQYLNLLFWVIALSSLAGGTACLLASIYANVERKRRDLAVLRLLGAHGADLSAFPLTSGFALTLGGLWLGFALFYAVSALINALFRSHLEQGESFCRLAAGQQVSAIVIALALALVAGLLASRRVSRIDPAESLRDE